MRTGRRRGVYGKDEGEGGRELDRAMSGATQGHGVYGHAEVGGRLGGGWMAEMSLQITV